MNPDWDRPGLAIEDHGPVTRFILSRPHAMNSYSPGLAKALNEALDSFACDSGKRVLVITGSGRVFCCGADLKFMAAHRADSTEVRAFLRDLNRFIDGLDDLDRPVIASVNGLAMGGGLETMLACDLVVACESARISDPHIKINAIHGAGGSQRLVRSVGLQRALDLVLTARELDACEAAGWGLVSRVVPDDALSEETLVLARELAGRDFEILSGLKRLVRLSASAALNHGLAVERDTFIRGALQPAFMQSMSTFATAGKPPRRR